MIVAITFGFGMHLHAKAEPWSAESSAEKNVAYAEQHDSLFDEIAEKELEVWRQLVA
jgi:hypothetical protein